ncbi:MAG TPA: CPBP family glutamic-type intramembrane protease [Gemmatimonadaceae bacterium]
MPVSQTHGVRNGADVVLKSLFALIAGPRGPLLFGITFIAGCVWFVRRDVAVHGGRLRLAVFAAMLAESTALALVFGIVVGTITARLLGFFGVLAIGPVEGLDAWTRLMVSLGAGLYEELLFRVVLVSALALVGRRVFGWRPVMAGAWAVILGAFMFSAFHYLGPYGDVLELRSFVFRMIAGLFFSALYLLRGFGIVAWTHALYDVLLLF